MTVIFTSPAAAAVAALGDAGAFGAVFAGVVFAGAGAAAGAAAPAAGALGAGAAPATQTVIPKAARSASLRRAGVRPSMIGLLLDVRSTDADVAPGRGFIVTHRS
jgi:hypothetical protein